MLIGTSKQKATWFIATVGILGGTLVYDGVVSRERGEILIGLGAVGIVAFIALVFYLEHRRDASLDD